MYKIIISILFISFFSVYAQPISKKEFKLEKKQNSLVSNYSKKLSANTKMFLKKLIDSEKNISNVAVAQLKKDYVLNTYDDITYISGLIKVSNPVCKSSLINYGVKINTEIGSILSVKIPLEAFTNIINEEAVEYIEIDEVLYPELDSARSVIKANLVQNGLENGLPDDLTGDGVIVGIIDSGFDYTHPAFLNEATDELRISRVWEQKNDGVPPAAYSYGSEYVGESAIFLREHDHSEASHGSHVASTAAGSGYETSGLYRGIASDAEIVLVSYYWPQQTKLSSTHSNILDGMKYIFDYANSQNKPAVINMSLGTHMGPHDGSTLFDIACDSILGPGRIFVKSAGNNGQNIIHFKYEFESNDTICHTFALKRFWSSYNLFDAWGTAGNDFCINVTLYNDTSDIVIDETGFVCASLDEPVEQYLYDEENNSCKIEFSPSFEEINGNPRINLKITNKTSYQTLLSIKSYDGTVQIWKDSYTDSSPFSNLDKEWATNGDNASTISEPGNGKTIITSGAFVSKDFYFNLENNKQFESQVLGDIASFSSLGPTGDGRVKPDICSPGSTIIAAVNSFDDGYTENGWYWSDVAAATGKWYYASMSGTSMSAPVTTGSIALMLQANPKLTPQNIKDAFKVTATRDNFTGSISTTASNIWGWGKMNLFEAVKYIYEISSASSNYQESKTRIYPNPNNGSFFLNINDIPKSNFNVSVFNSIGENLYSKNYMINEFNDIIPLMLNTLSNGVYYLKINSKDFQDIVPFVIEN